MRRRGRSRQVLRHTRLALLAVGAVGIMGFGLWSASSGWAVGQVHELRRQGLEATADLGFAVDQVLVYGRRRTDPELLRLVLGIDSGQPMFGFDPASALQSVESISWVQSASIERRLPGTVIVTLTERSPIAIWQQDQHLKLIDAEGVVLTDRNLERYSYLPLVVGPDAAGHAAELLAMLSQAPAVADKLSSAVRVSERRWDLVLDNGSTVRLPEINAPSALERVVALDAESGLLSRDILTIDARWDDRMIIEVSPAADAQLRLPGQNT